MPAPNKTAEVRRKNLLNLIAAKYNANRAEFSRAVGKNSNLINLVLSTNEEFRRNIGETLARDLEERAGLPAGWLDTEQHGGPTGSVSTFPIIRLGQETDGTEKLVLASDIVSRQLDNPTALVNIKACFMPTAEMAPAINRGDLMFIDTGVKAVAAEGVYVLVNGKDVFVRRVKKTLTGTLRASADSDSSVEDLPAKIKIAGRICGLMKFAQP